jgi:hypothetical protein
MGLTKPAVDNGQALAARPLGAARANKRRKHHVANAPPQSRGRCRIHSRLALLSVVVLVLEFLEPANVVRKNVPIARRKAVIVGRLSNGINHIIQQPVVPPALIEISLHLRQFLLGSRDAVPLSVRCASGPDVLQIGSYVQKDMRPPPFSAKAILAIAIPVLSGSAQRD